MHSLFHHVSHNNDESNSKEVHENNKLSYSEERLALDQCVLGNIDPESYPVGSSACVEEISALKRSLKSSINDEPPAIVSSPLLGRSPS